MVGPGLDRGRRGVLCMNIYTFMFVQTPSAIVSSCLTAYPSEGGRTDASSINGIYYYDRQSDGNCPIPFPKGAVRKDWDMSRINIFLDKNG